MNTMTVIVDGEEQQREYVLERQYPFRQDPGPWKRQPILADNERAHYLLGGEVHIYKTFER